MTGDDVEGTAARVLAYAAHRVATEPPTSYGVMAPSDVCPPGALLDHVAALGLSYRVDGWATGAR